MNRQVHIVGLGGSLATPSTSLAALRLALDGAQAEGATIESFSVRDLDLPMYEPGAPVPIQVEKLCDSIESCVERLPIMALRLFQLAELQEAVADQYVKFRRRVRFQFAAEGDSPWSRSPDQQVTIAQSVSPWRSSGMKGSGGAICQAKNAPSSSGAVSMYAS